MTEVELLSQDILLITEAFRGLTSKNVLESPTSDHAEYFTIVIDLWGKCLSRCMAVPVLLKECLFEPALILTRAAYEAAINLKWLVTMGSKHENALLARAYTYLEVADGFKNIPSDEAAQEAERILQRMPPEIVRKARQRARAKAGWSGVPLLDMARRVGFRGHRAIYAFLSRATHPRSLGYDVQERARHGDRFVLEYRTPGDSSEVEALANFTRRLIHAMYEIVAADFYGEVPKLPTPDPFQTNQEELRHRGLEEWDPDER